MGSRQGPKAIHSRSYLRDPIRGEFVPQDIPTVTVKAATVLATHSANAALLTTTPSGTAPLRLTYLHLMARAQTDSFSLADRGGTFDHFELGTAAGGNVGQVEGVSVTLRGNALQPIHTVLGTLTVYGGAGSQSGGTYIVAYEGVQ